MKKLIAILILMLAPTAHAEGDDWSTIWTLTLTEVLEVYLAVDDKAAADGIIEDYLDGFAHGIAATYNYGGGNGNSILACYRVSGMTPAFLRRRLLLSAMDPDLNKLKMATYMYAVIHIHCDVVLGGYEGRSEEESTAS